MTSFKKVSTASRLTDLKRNCLTEAILTCNLAWKDLEGHLDYQENSFEEAITELQVRENCLDSRCKSLAESEEEFESLSKSLESRREEQDRKEAEFDLFQHEYFRTREELMESRFADIQRHVEERIDDACFKEEMLCLKVDLMFTDIDNRLDDLRVKELQHEERWNGLLQREKQDQVQARMIKYTKRSKSLKRKEKVLQNCSKQKKGKANESKGKELDSNIKHFEASFDQSVKEFDVIEKQFKLDKENFDLQIRKLELKLEELVEKLNEVDQIRELFEVDRMYLHDQQVYIDQSLEEFHLKEKQFKLDKKELDLHIKELELKREELARKSKEIEQAQESFKEVEIERKHLHDRRMDIDDANVFVECDPSDGIQTSIVTCFLDNMDGRCLLQFLSKHSTELDLMQEDVSNALKMSSDSGRIVIVAIMEEFKGENIPSCSMMSFLFVLEMLAGNIPIEIIKSPDVVKAAMEVAFEWKEKLTLKNDPLYTLGFLQLVCTYKLASKFDQDEIYNLCCSVADDCDGLVPELSEILSCSENDPVSKILNVFQDKIDRPKKAHGTGTVPDLFLLSPNPASLLLDAMQCCFDSTVKGTMKVFLPLLKEIVNVNLEIDIHNIQNEAFSLAAVWKSKLLFSNTPEGPEGLEVLCFLLFLSIYKLGSWFNQEELLCLLINCKSNFSGYLLHNLGLEQMLIGFIQKLVAEGKQLKAVVCIYDFDLVDKFPPVPILKNYLETAVVEARDNSVEKELSEVQAVIKCIVDRGLLSFSPLKPLAQRVVELILQVKDGSKKRPAPLPDSTDPNLNLEAHSGKKVCIDVSEL